MNIIQTYQQGGRHKNENHPCEDRTYSLSENGVDVIALADGAGSSKYTHSAQGAACVTETISKFFCNNFDKFYEKEDNEELSSVIMAVCQRALQKKVEESGLDDISRLSSTLLCVAVKNGKVICCHIGDGVIGKLTPEGTTVVSSPENGEFSGTTYFITNSNAYEHIRIIKDVLGDAISYFLMSDGTSDYIYNKFDNSFYEAAKKMVLMAIEENGQTNLENTVKNYMVEKDPKSDDCSFICLTIDPKESATDEPSAVSNALDETSKTGSEKSVNENEPQNPAAADLSGFSENNAKQEENSNKERSSKIKKTKKPIIIVAAVLSVTIALLSLTISKFSSDNKKEKTTVSTSVSTTETTTTKPNVSKNGANTTESETIATTSSRYDKSTSSATTSNKQTTNNQTSTHSNRLEALNEFNSTTKN